jgi:hypothetical protein
MPLACLCKQSSILIAVDVSQRHSEFCLLQASLQKDDRINCHIDKAYRQSTWSTWKLLHSTNKILGWRFDSLKRLEKIGEKNRAHILILGFDNETELGPQARQRQLHYSRYVRDGHGNGQR